MKNEKLLKNVRSEGGHSSEFTSYTPNITLKGSTVSFLCATIHHWVPYMIPNWVATYSHVTVQ